MSQRFVGLIGFLLATAASLSSTAFGQVGKGQRILIEQGLQINGMVNAVDPFHLSTYQNLNYSAINWIWDSNVSAHGSAPGAMPWGRWVHPGTNPPSTAEMPGGAEDPYISRLIALSFGDEPNLNDPGIRDTYVNWFNSVQNDPKYAKTILYMNNYGGQVSDAALGDFITRARPDMITFDTYPYRYSGTARVQPFGGSPMNWYADFRRYRQHAKGANIPLGTYRQTFGSIDEGVRHMSESELRLQTFAALAFNAKYLSDFTYNTGANSFFDKSAGGDNSPNAFYTSAQTANRHARNLGKALVQLKPVADADGVAHTTSMMFIRGKHRNANGVIVRNWSNGDGSDNVEGYTGFARDPSSPDYTDWAFGRNDPYLSGPFNDAGTTNLGTFNEGLDGDVMISWFKPLDESLDGPLFSDQVYLMVVNGLADMDGDAAQTAQRIRLNFGSSSVRFPYNHLEKLDRETGLVVDVPLTQLSNNVWQLDMVFEGGTGELFKFPTGAPFVGVPEPAALALLPLVAVILRRRRGGGC